MRENSSYSGEEPKKTSVVIGPQFKLVFLTVLSITVLSLFISVFLVIFYSDPLSPSKQSLIETCSTIWKMGFGCIVGLIGGKSAS
jgi:hypothetical protein